MPRAVREMRPFLIIGAIFMVLSISIDQDCLPISDGLLWFYTALLLALYASLLHAIAAWLEPSKSFAEVLSVALFLITSVLLVLGFAYAWFVFGHFGPSSGNAPVTKIDAIYFSVVALTTLGFGDFLPIGSTGKLLLSIEALMGATHMVAFFSVVLTRMHPKP